MSCCVALMQPYLFPAPAYLQLAHAADVFIFYDDARFSHGRWTHRNRIRVNGEPHLFTVPLAARSPGLNLDEIALHPTGFARWRRKMLATMTQAYARAPFATTILPELEALLAKDHRNLAALAAASVRWLAGRFGIAPRWDVASANDYDRTGTAEQKVLSLVERAGGTDYVNMPGGRALYDPTAFADRALRLGFIENRASAGDGLDLSALHAVLHLPPDELAVLGANYRIDWGTR